MKLSVFKDKVTQNPWNALDQKEAKDFINKRRQHINNWREVIYKDIEEKYDIKDAEKVGDDYFEGDVAEKENDEDKKEETNTEKELAK